MMRLNCPACCLENMKRHGGAGGLLVTRLSRLEEVVVMLAAAHPPQFASIPAADQCRSFGLLNTLNHHSDCMREVALSLMAT